MTGRAPSFLSRLAPSAAATSFAVRAALPARYASNGAGLRIDEQVESVADPKMATRQADAPVTAPSLRADAAAPTVPGGAIDSGAAVVVEPPCLASERPDAPASAISVTQPQRAEARPPAADPVAVDPARIAIAQPQKMAAKAAIQGRPPAPPETPAPGSSGPLNPGTIMERALAAQRAEPDVVKVTIDRIDIRMPPEAGHAASRPEPRRRAAPTLSLGDYLRGVDSTSRRR